MIDAKVEEENEEWVVIFNNQIELNIINCTQYFNIIIYNS